MTLSLRIAHVSDLHLSPRAPGRLEQADHIAASLKEVRPHVIVVTGDLTDDGWTREQDLLFARDWLNCLGLPWRAVPGNHDVGNFANLPEGGITVARTEAWNRLFNTQTQPLAENPFTADAPEGGVCGWVQHLPGWTLIGLNSMLLGSGLAFEDHQRKAARQAVMAGEQLGNQIVVFQHSPLVIDKIDETTGPNADYWLGSQQARAQLVEAIASPQLRLIASGHVHQSRLQTHAFLPGCSTTSAWAPPASGTWVTSRGLPNPPAPEKTGYFLHTLSATVVTTERIDAAPILKTVDFSPWPQ